MKVHLVLGFNSKILTWTNFVGHKETEPVSPRPACELNVVVFLNQGNWSFGKLGFVSVYPQRGCYHAVIKRLHFDFLFLKTKVESVINNAIKLNSDDQDIFNTHLVT